MNIHCKTRIGTSARQRTEGVIHDVSLGSIAIPVSDSVNSFGVTIDSTLSFDDHVNDACRASYQFIRALRHVRKCISDDDAKSIAVSIMSGKLY